MARPRQTARCDRPSPSQRQRFEDRVVMSEGVEGFTTPPRGAVTVNVEEVRSALLDYTIDSRTSHSDSTAAVQGTDSTKKNTNCRSTSCSHPLNVQQLS